MKNVKMSLANIQGKLSRTELKNIMAGSSYGGGGTTCLKCYSQSDCEPFNLDCRGTVSCDPGTWCSRRYYA